MQGSQVLPQEISTLLITGGSGSGTTELTAFDAALADAGIHNANLIRVSSITPATATTHISRADTVESAITPGEFVPVVYARCQSCDPGDTICAAVAGATLEEGYGVNVEHHERNTTSSAVEKACLSKLDELAAIRESSISADPWVHSIETNVPPSNEAERWYCAVAAIVYR